MLRYDRACTGAAIASPLLLVLSPRPLLGERARVTGSAQTSSHLDLWPSPPIGGDWRVPRCAGAGEGVLEASELSED